MTTTKIIGSFKYTEPDDEWTEGPVEIELTIVEARYKHNNTLAIELNSDRYGPYARLSENVEGISEALTDDQFICKKRELIPDLLEACLNSGYFEDTGKKVSYGFVTRAPVWKLVRKQTSSESQ